MLEQEPRCGRLDWERNSLYVNIGNTFSRQGAYDKANDKYNIAEKLGRDHIEAEEGNRIDGMGMAVVAMRGRAFALKKTGREAEGKEVLKKVIEMQIQLNDENEKKRVDDEKKMEEAAEAAAAADAQPESS